VLAKVGGSSGSRNSRLANVKISGLAVSELTKKVGRLVTSGLRKNERVPTSGSQSECI
jgi:hypothetical protein